MRKLCAFLVSATVCVAANAQYFDAETGLNYNGKRDYDPQVGRYLESDPLGIEDGFSTYAYARSQPISLSDPFGLATFLNFPPDKEAEMKLAVEEAKKKVRDCAGKPDCFKDDGREEIIKNIDSAKYVYKPNLNVCGQTLRFPPFWRSISVGPAAFEWTKCCDLASTLAHEANHLGRLSGGSEAASRELEKTCFNCPRAQK